MSRLVGSCNMSEIVGSVLTRGNLVGPHDDAPRRPAGPARDARRSGMSAPGVAELRAGRLPRARRRARRSCARCSAASAAAPNGWSSTGGVPRSECERMRAPLQEGDFPFPGEIRLLRGRPWSRQGPPDLVGPHGLLPASASGPLRRARPRSLTPLPEACRPRRAVARRQHGDGAQRALGFRRRAGRPDRRRRRRRRRPAGRLPRGAAAGRGGDARRCRTRRAALCAALGAAFAQPSDAPARCGRGVPRQRHARRAWPPRSPAPASRRTVVELSWYGDGAVPAPLGRRLPQPAAEADLIAGRSGRALAPAALGPIGAGSTRRSRCLRDDELDALITEEIAFEDLPARCRAARAGAPGLATAIRY